MRYVLINQDCINAIRILLAFMAGCYVSYMFFG
jgi:hypothetical protein